MKRLTRVFLVLLRLVIGWHLLVEGLYKIADFVVRQVDPATGKPRRS